MRFPGLRLCRRLKHNERMLNLEGIGCQTHWVNWVNWVCFFDVRIQHSSETTWAWQTSLTTFIYEASRMHIFPLIYCIFFKMWLCSTRNASFWHNLLACLQYWVAARAIQWAGLLSLTPAFRNVLTYPTLSLGSKPPTLSDFAQMFKEKEFFFFKWKSRAWQKYCIKKCKIQHGVEKLAISSLPSLSNFSTSKKINMETITLAQGLTKSRKWAAYGLTGHFPLFLYAEL